MEVKNTLHVCNTTLKDEMEAQRAASNAPFSVGNDSKIARKFKTCELDSSMSPKRKNNILSHPAFLTSNVLLPTLKTSYEPDLDRDHSSVPQFSTEKVQFKSQQTSPYMDSSFKKMQLNPNRYRDNYISYASKQLTPIEKGIKLMNFFFTL